MKEVKDKTLRALSCVCDFSVPELPVLSSSPQSPQSPHRRKNNFGLRFARSFVFWGAMLVFTPAIFAQANNSQNTPHPPAPAAATAAAPGLSHDLSGVWMPYSVHIPWRAAAVLADCGPAAIAAPS